MEVKSDMKELLPPFRYTYSPSLSKLLWDLGCTLVLSTYQAGKVIFIRATGPENIEQQLLDFPRPMGLAISDRRIAVATRDEVVVLTDTSAEASIESPQAEKGTYLPEATYSSGAVDTHDLAWGEEGLWAINTLFSSMALAEDNSSFESQWRPPFVSDLAPEDRCHLNGMAMVDGQPEYVTAFGKVDTLEGWRPNKASGGILMHVPSGEIVLGDLPMPHSPRVYDGKLYLLLSATGELVRADPEKGSYEVVARLPGFVRGMACYGAHLFVGLSKLRKTSSTFGDLPISQQSVFSGIVAVSLPDGRIVGHLKYETGCEEIYDVQVLPEPRQPGPVGQSTINTL